MYTCKSVFNIENWYIAHTSMKNKKLTRVVEYFVNILWHAKTSSHKYYWEIYFYWNTYQISWTFPNMPSVKPSDDAGSTRSYKLNNQGHKRGAHWNVLLYYFDTKNAIIPFFIRNYVNLLFRNSKHVML